MVANTAKEPIEHHLFERPLPHCPSCGSTDLMPLERNGNVDYVCGRCRTRWHVELGAYWRIDGP
jgi:transposase-like protein